MRNHPFDTKRDEATALIAKIADRAVSVYAKHSIRIDRQDVLLDLLAVHFKAVPLRLADLLAADDVNFLHDVGGMNRHLDRNTYQLRDSWSPRYADRSASLKG